MESKMKLSLIMLLLTTFGHAQFGEFGEVKIGIGSYLPEDSKVATSENLGSLFTGEPSRSSVFLSQPRLEVSYHRFYALNLSNYISWGIGYSYFRTEINLESGTDRSAFELFSQLKNSHYAMLPIKFHQLVPFVKKSNQRDDEILTGNQRTDSGGAIRFSAGLNVYYSFLNTNITDFENEDEEVSEYLSQVAIDLSENFNKIMLVPELTIDVLFAENWTFGVTGGYRVNPIYDNDPITLNTSGGPREFTFEEDFDNNITLTLGIAYRH